MAYQSDRIARIIATCRAAGYAVNEVPGWQSRGHGDVSPKSVICHHTAGPLRSSTTLDYPSLGTVLSGRPDLAGPLAQFGIGFSGRIYVIAAGLAYHAGTVFNKINSNANSIGIEAENIGTGADPWPEAQMNAYAFLVRAIIGEYAIPLNEVLGHKEVASPRGRKIDPNFDMNSFRGRVANIGLNMAPLADPVTGASPTSPNPANTVVPRIPAPDYTVSILPSQAANNRSPFVPLKLSGNLDFNTIRALEWVTGAPTDGVWADNSKKALQRHLGVTVDGVIGPSDIRALQQRIGYRPIDGLLGPETLRALQDALNKAEF